MPRPTGPDDDPEFLRTLGSWTPVPERPVPPNLDELFRWRRGDVVAMVVVLVAGALAFLVSLLPG